MLFYSWLITFAFAHSFSSQCPETVDASFMDRLITSSDENWKTSLSAETLEDILDVLEKHGTFTEHLRYLTHSGVQCWYKMPSTSHKKLELIIQNY
jgi:hypothetical protein